MTRMDEFIAKLGSLPEGHADYIHDGRRYGGTLSVSADRRRFWFYAEELGGTDRISCNLYLLAGGKPLLRPCDMPAEKVVDFVIRCEQA
ncbi:hypothetical protein [Aureimonas psammosilenae]|uniref:hypothetical protein n=1 Tax=Aureimonas psammosilenae TaxID=2495496 RepID=UPI001F482599|nr:hypothetical protein [Aureimonas psammosilenae]